MNAEIKERLADRDRRIKAMRRRDTRAHYQELNDGKANGKKIAWTPAAWAAPLLDACGIMTCSPENYTANCAAMQLAGRFCHAAEMKGISQDLCSYGRCIMGMMWEKDGPFGAMPAPDMTINVATICDAHAKMWDIPAQHFGVPCFTQDGHFKMNGRVTQRDVDYTVAELHRLVRFCEEHFGAKFDYDRFKENMRVEGQTRSLFTEMQNLRKEIPCPRSTRDTVGEIFHSHIVAHRPEAVEYFTLVLEDCRERVEHKVGVVENERFRLYYDNIPLWFWLGFFDHLQDQGAVFVSDWYSTVGFNGFYADGGRFDPERPFEALARRQTYQLGCTGIDAQFRHYARMIEDWHCDGVVYFVNRSCKVMTTGRSDKLRFIKSRFDIPVLEFEGEMADPSSIDRADVLERAKRFVEALEERAVKAQLR